MSSKVEIGKYLGKANMNVLHQIEAQLNKDKELANQVGINTVVRMLADPPLSLAIDTLFYMVLEVNETVIKSEFVEYCEEQGWQEFMQWYYDSVPVLLGKKKEVSEM